MDWSGVLEDLFQPLRELLTGFGAREWLVLFALLFFGLLFLVSRGFGWHKLARHYASRNRYRGTWISQPHEDGKGLGGLMLTFNHCESEDAVRLGADGKGLYLQAWIGFRPFHPPLFFPWSDVRCAGVAELPWTDRVTLYRFTFAKSPTIPLDVDGHVAREIELRSQGRWTMPADR